MFLLRPLIKFARLLLPDDLDWIADLATDLLRTIPPLVRRLEDPKFGGLPGRDKARAVVEEVRRILDAADDIPGWRELPEHRRDALIGAVSEIALFVIEVSGGRFSPSPIEVDNVRKLRRMPGRMPASARGVETALKRLDGRA